MGPGNAPEAKRQLRKKVSTEVRIGGVSTARGHSD